MIRIVITPVSVTKFKVPAGRTFAMVEGAVQRFDDPLQWRIYDR